MRVADVTMFYAPRSGGVRRYVEAKRAWLKAQGWSHHLVIPNIGTAEDGAVFVRGLPLPGSNGYRMPLGAGASARALAAANPDVIEAGDPFVASAALRAARALDVPAIAFCHADLPRVAGARFGARAERLVARYYIRAYRSFDRVLAPSRWVTARLESWGVAHVRHQPLGVDLETFRPDRRDPHCRERFELEPESRVVAFAGRLAPEKNLDVLADAMRRLGPPYVALLVGAGTAPSPLPANVRVVEYMTGRTALASLLASCDAFVHTGDQETFGLALLEAMACGLPVIATAAGGVVELVPRECGMLVPPRDPDALAEAIAALFASDRDRMSVEARRHAERYAWSRIVPQIVAEYHALMSRTASAPAVAAA